MRLRAAGLTLALAAITFKAFLPPGFMFSEQGGQAAVVLCTIDGVALSHDGDEPQKQTPGSAGQQCPFAVASAAAFAPDFIEAPAPREAAFVVATATPLAERPAALPVGPPLPARGPPLQA